MKKFLAILLSVMFVSAWAETLADTNNANAQTVVEKTDADVNKYQKENKQNNNPPEEELSKEERIIKEMLSKNPFADSPNSTSSKAEEQIEVQAPEGLELRGIARVDGEWIFFIHDTPAKLDYKIGLKEPITEKTPYTIDFYDDETNSVSISNNVGTYVITLKTPDAPSGKMSSQNSAAKTKPKTPTVPQRPITIRR